MHRLQWNQYFRVWNLKIYLPTIQHENTLNCFFLLQIVTKEELIIYVFSLGMISLTEPLFKPNPYNSIFRFSKFLLGTVKVTPELNEVGEIDNDESMSEWWILILKNINKVDRNLNLGISLQKWWSEQHTFVIIKSHPSFRLENFQVRSFYLGGPEKGRLWKT